MKRNFWVTLFVVFTLSLTFAGNAFAAKGKFDYYIKKGDNLWSLCEKHYGKGGGNRYYEEVAIASNILEPDFIHPGDGVKFVPRHLKAKHVEKKQHVVSKKIRRPIKKTMTKFYAEKKAEEKMPDVSIVKSAPAVNSVVVAQKPIAEEINAPRLAESTVKQIKGVDAKNASTPIPAYSAEDIVLKEDVAEYYVISMSQLIMMAEALSKSYSEKKEEVLETGVFEINNAGKERSSEAQFVTFPFVNYEWYMRKKTKYANAFLVIDNVKKNEVKEIDQVANKMIDGSSELAFDGSFRFMYGCNDLSRCKGLSTEVNMFREKKRGFGFGLIFVAYASEGNVDDSLGPETDSTEWTRYGLGMGPSAKYVGNGFFGKDFQLTAKVPIEFQSLKNDVNVSIPQYNFNKDFHSEQKSWLLAPTLEFETAINKKVIVGTSFGATLPLSEKMSQDNKDMQKVNLVYWSTSLFTEAEISKNFTLRGEYTPYFGMRARKLEGMGGSIEAKFLERRLGIRFTMNHHFNVSADMKVRGVSQSDINTYDGSLIFYFGDTNRNLR